MPPLLAIRVPGELAAVSGGGRSATVTTCGAVRSTVIQRAGSQTFAVRYPAVAAQVAATVGRRLRFLGGTVSGEIDRAPSATGDGRHARLSALLADPAAVSGLVDRVLRVVRDEVPGQRL